MHSTHARWRRRPLGWRERSALIVLAVAAVPIALILSTAVFLLVVGLGTIALAAWLIGSVLRPRRAQPSATTVITTDYARLSEESETPTRHIPWTRR